MATDTSNPNGTGAFDAQSAFASLLAVEDGEPAAGEALQEEETSSTEVEASETEDEVAAEQDAEAESESEEEAEPEEEEAAPATYRVKVDGEEVEVTLDELQKGYSRTQDYTRKTQALAEQRKAAEPRCRTARAASSRAAVRAGASGACVLRTDVAGGGAGVSGDEQRTGLGCPLPRESDGMGSSA